jgi:hypothetical protein
MKNLNLNFIDMHSIWRWQMIKNTILLIIIGYFLKFDSFNKAAFVCLISGALTYGFFWFDKRNLNNPKAIERFGLDVMRKTALKTLLSSLSWFILSAILYLMSIVTILGLLKPYLG